MMCPPLTGLLFFSVSILPMFLKPMFRNLHIILDICNSKAIFLMAKQLQGSNIVGFGKWRPFSRVA
jgi:hypothetical protein